MSTGKIGVVNILDLPNEILLNIMRKLDMIDVLYSLVGVNQRCDRLVLDPLYTNDIDLTIKSLINNNFWISRHLLDRICEVLPRISSNIKKFTLDQHSMERILSVTIYPQLYSLTLGNIQSFTILINLIGDTKLRYLLTNQITHVNIDIFDKMTRELDNENELNIFALILSISKCVTDLTFSQWLSYKNSPISIFHLPSTSCVSSTLTKLNIVVNTFDDCLYLLDGRLDSLSTLIINILEISAPLSNIDNTKPLFKLKYFSLITYNRTCFYDSRVMPLLCRMSNLEELILYLPVRRTNSTYIDGTHLYDEVLIHMPQLNKFNFNINTLVFNTDTRIILPSNNDIQRSFIERGYQQIDSYTHKRSTKNVYTCHIYSLPYQFNNFFHMNCHFPGGIFEKVRCVMMNDREYPFERELFQVVSHSFPFLRQLAIFNSEPQKRKQYSSIVITFPYLRILDLRRANVDYGSEFLCSTKIQLPCLLELRINYESLVMITNSFTNHWTRVTCTQLQSLTMPGFHALPENFYTYFPSCNLYQKNFQ